MLHTSWPIMTRIQSYSAVAAGAMAAVEEVVGKIFRLRG